MFSIRIDGYLCFFRFVNFFFFSFPKKQSSGVITRPNELVVHEIGAAFHRFGKISVLSGASTVLQYARPRSPMGGDEGSEESRRMCKQIRRIFSISWRRLELKISVKNFQDTLLLEFVSEKERIEKIFFRIFDVTLAKIFSIFEWF